MCGVLLQFFLSSFCTIFPQHRLPVSSRNRTVDRPDENRHRTAVPVYSRDMAQKQIRRLRPAALGKERTMAIPMSKQQDIRRLDRQGVSRSEIARRLNVDRATVAKYADMDDMTPKPPTDRRRGSKIDPYAELVDGWLEADRMLPRKQRHTAKRVHDRLRAETDYDGEYTTTLRYVRRWREANRSGFDGYGELVWALGVAQIDFGVAKACIAGELVDDHLYSVKSRWTLSALNLNTFGVQVERRRRLVLCLCCLSGWLIS